jgi:glycosyltransferase involved in cell wall biosynthesis
MKILLDQQIFNYQEFGGISRYYAEVWKELKANGTKIDCPLLFTNNLYAREYGISKYKNFTLKESGKGAKYALRILNGINSRILNWSMERKNYDVFVPTYYNPYFLNYIGNKPFVITVYDMIHELFPQYFENDKHSLYQKKSMIEKSSKIIAISENTKQDIIRIYPNIKADKIEVVYLNHSMDTNNFIKIDGLPENYILFVGSRGGYKQFETVLKSVASLLKRDRSLSILCAGGGAFNESEKNMIKELGIDGQVAQKRFENNELVSYYINARCFVFPSEYEGFGIPVLEAMACGCPVVLGHHSSFPEVAGDAGVYFDNSDNFDLTCKIESLLNNETLRREYSQKGLQQVKKFSWRNTAEQCLNVYKSVI